MENTSQIDKLEELADRISQAKDLLLTVLDFIESECPNEYNNKPLTVAAYIFPKLNRYKSVLSCAIQSISQTNSQLYSICEEEWEEVQA